MIRPGPAVSVDVTRWPGTVAAVAQILAEGLVLPGGLTVLVGENGSGKSTVVEMIAEACGLNPQGGSALSELFRLRGSEPGIGQRLVVERSAGRRGWSYFLCADTMHSLYTYLEENPGRRPERFHELSHGEGLLEILRTRVSQPGFYLMDEPDAPLSFTSCLALAALLHDLRFMDEPGSYFATCWVTEPPPGPRSGPALAPAAAWRHMSRMMVTGPSLTRLTFMFAPNTPVSTWAPSPRSDEIIAVTSGSATGPGAAACQVGRRPFRVSAYRVNWLMTRSGAAMSEQDFSPSRMRSPQSLAASFAAVSGVSSWVTPTSTSRPGSVMAPVTCPSTATLAWLTRCTTARTAAHPF